MKKILVALMLGLVSISILGQDVSILQDENLGDRRQIQTDYTPMAKKGLVELPFSLQYVSTKYSSEAYYTMTFKLTLGSVPQSLPSGSKMYLKLDNDSILEFETMNDIAEYDNTFQYMELFGCLYYYMYPTYYASSEQIDMLMKHKVVKIRRQVTWGEGFYDIPDNRVFKQKHICFTENLIRMKLSIDKRLNAANNQNALLEGF